VTEASNDKKQLMPMVELIEQQSGQRPEAILADNGYCSEENLESLESAEEPKRRIEGSSRRASKSMANIDSRRSAVRLTHNILRLHAACSRDERH